MSNKSLKSWQGTLAVVGVDWGDSGKGRLIDDLSSKADIIARYNGGSNTGHSVKNQFGDFALHIIPSGIFNPKAICLVGRNVAVDLESLVQEMDQLNKSKVSYKNLILDEQASLTMPWHKLRDGMRERKRNNKIGTTGRGVGPTYADRTERVGLLLKDLISADFEEKLKQEIEFQNECFRLNLNLEKICQRYSQIKNKIKFFVGSTTIFIKEARKKSKNILFEGAQGYFLDIDAGTYPFVTSSNPGTLGIWRSFDLHPKEIDEAIGITKAYTTRVGEGPMPTLIETDEKDLIIKEGREIGTTTGRVRRPGWLDLVLLKEAVEVNGLTGLAITKLDVLAKLKKIKICTAYNLNGKAVTYPAHDADTLSKVKATYQELDGWNQDVTNVRDFAKLPDQAKKYIKMIEDYVKIPVKFISVGPKRGEVIYA